ncbi:MAG: lipoate--protein ligase [Candidatus Phytoplasma pruni]|uniref:lipoate--protein ligase n=1 Tax=Milkweed yellows phytoplasma TaxID=208434 RepID=UPI00037BFD57|nr:lipoate--protein ligase [Milkweed yellows phytoplasma]
MILVKFLRNIDLKPYFYYALEEYILNNVLKEMDEVFFFLWTIKGVVIGKNQVIENEVNLDYVKKNKINLFRRPTGGGCVYNDEETPLYSIITKRKNQNFTFKEHLNKIIPPFKKLGVDLYFSGRNDILLENKKVSGNAFLQNQNGIIIHGTLLYNCDIDVMVRCITPSNEKLISKGIDSVSARVTNLKDHLDGMSKDELVRYLEKELAQKEYVLSEEEIAKVEMLSQKYSSEKWLYFEHPQYSKTLKKHFSWGKLEILLDLQKGKIQQMNLRGDFFHKEDNLSLFIDPFIDVYYRKEDLEKVLKTHNIGDFILNANNQDLLSLLEEGLLI